MRFPFRTWDASRRARRAAFSTTISPPRTIKRTTHGCGLALTLRTRQTADGIEETCGAFIADRREDILLCEQQFGLFDGIADKDLPVQFP